MLTGVDHLVVAVTDAQAARRAYTALGFDLQPGDDGEYVAANSSEALHLAPVGEPIGLRWIVLESDNLDEDTARINDCGLLDAPFRLVAAAASRRQSGTHPNGVVHLERTYIVVPDVHAVAARYAQALGIAVPPVQRGNVIKADMCVFDVGAVGIGVAQPMEPGPAAEALEHRGPGPFQALYRTRSMDSAAAWLAQHGVPPPARGTRNTGEQAMLVAPTDAWGVYIGFVGQR
jgi:glyoxalase/bleomycin resistance protein/dioxygenase superfamily protein